MNCFRILSLAALLALHSTLRSENGGADDAGAVAVSISGKGTVEEAPSKFSWDVSYGYDTEYVNRGFSWAEDLHWGQAAANYAINDQFSLWAAAWRGSDSAGEYHELDLMTELGWTRETLYIGLGVNHYSYPRSDWQSQLEFSLNGSYGVGKTPLSIIGSAFCDVVIDAWFFNGGAQWSSKLSDRVKVEATAQVSYNHRYFTEASGMNNVDLRLALPVAVSKRLEIAPYFARTISLDVQQQEETPSMFYGGIALTMTF